ncbi:hypothetical protein AVEN_253080-1 [Araneus ventricosus]|uniref:Uncharacterized protein n=1 Tax=Araneus ventricosus TaxID=182803 RepID=A0A4Y2FL68_ARAVE|nr:hypothetical protein AVEN_253080-1 [Araneus ventricosus]
MGKGTVRIKTLLAKERQPRQVESEWIEHAVECHILPNQNEASLSLTKERVSNLIGKKGDLRNLVFLTCQGERKRAYFRPSGEDFAGQLRPHNKETDFLSEMKTGKEICGSFLRQSA